MSGLWVKPNMLLIAGNRARNPVGRFAPTPSGKLHVGNAFSFLIAYLQVRQHNGSMRMRVEDIDTARCKSQYIDSLFKDFEWLGFSWDGEVVYQSKRLDAYEEAFSLLQHDDRLYQCFCSRADIHAASAPHEGEEIIYPGTCRNLSHDELVKRSSLKSPSYRIKVPSTLFCFDDLFQGQCSFDLSSMSGDFVVRRSDDVFAYQLAVVIDDAAMGVTSVVRGLDLLTSAPRQQFLQDCLHLPHVDYGHLPLMVDKKGRRLSKRAGDISIEYFRTKPGFSAEEFWGKLAYSCGIVSDEQPSTLDDLVKEARLDALKGKETIEFFDCSIC